MAYYAPDDKNRRELLSVLLRHGACSETLLWRKSCMTGSTLTLWSNHFVTSMIKDGLIERQSSPLGEDQLTITAKGVKLAECRFNLDVDGLKKEFSIAQPTRISKMSGHYIPPPQPMVVR